MTRVVASIEARMGASRLPGKMMEKIAGFPAICWVTERVRRAERLDDLVIATTTNPADDVIAEWAEQAQVSCYRGSENDVLARVVGAQRERRSDVVVELCGDCPLIDPAVIDMGIERFFSSNAHVVSTVKCPSFPQGVDVEIFSMPDLEHVEKTVSDPEVREHVSLEFYRRPEKYRVESLEAPQQIRRPEVRLLLDYPDDLEFLRAVCEPLYREHGFGFETRTVIEFLDQAPEVVAINASRSEVSPV